GVRPPPHEPAREGDAAQPQLRQRAVRARHLGQSLSRPRPVHAGRAAARTAARRAARRRRGALHPTRRAALHASSERGGAAELPPAADRHAHLAGRDDRLRQPAHPGLPGRDLRAAPLPRQPPQHVVGRGRLRCDRRAALHWPEGAATAAGVRHPTGRHVRAAAVRAQRQDGRARADHDQGARHRERGHAAAADRGGRPVRPNGAPGAEPAVRLRLDAPGKPDHAGGAAREAGARRPCGEADVALIRLAACLVAGLIVAALAGCTPPPPQPAPAARPAASDAAPAGAPPAATAGAPQAAQSGPLSPPVAVKFGDLPATSNAAIYVALDRGYFKEEGLDVTLETFDSFERAMPALATNQLDAAGGGVNAGMFSAIARGLPLKIVAGISRNEPGYSSSALVVRKELIDSGRVRDYADLRGLRISLVSATSGLGAEFTRVLEMGGLRE